MGFRGIGEETGEDAQQDDLFFSSRSNEIGTEESYIWISLTTVGIYATYMV